MQLKANKFGQDGRVGVHFSPCQPDKACMNNFKNGHMDGQIYVHVCLQQFINFLDENEVDDKSQTGSCILWILLQEKNYKCCGAHIAFYL